MNRWLKRLVSRACLGTKFKCDCKNCIFKDVLQQPNQDLKYLNAQVIWLVISKHILGYLILQYSLVHLFQIRFF